MMKQYEYKILNPSDVEKFTLEGVKQGKTQGWLELLTALGSEGWLFSFELSKSLVFVREIDHHRSISSNRDEIKDRII